MENHIHREDVVSHATMAFLALLIGIASGLAAILFHHMINFLHNLFFLRTIDFHFDPTVHLPTNPWGIWIILVPTSVAIIVAWLVSKFAPEAKGHGVPEVMDAIYYKDAKIRPAVALIKAISSSLTIGSGGSVGREGPIVQISAALGSFFGSIVRMPAKQRAVLVAAGAAAGIGSVFNTPIGALAFSIEIMMVSINASTLFPVVIATVTATYIGRVFFGTLPPFYVWALSLPHFRLMPPELLITLIPFGIFIGCLAAFFIRGLYFFEDIFDDMPGNYYVRHVLGMFLMGVIMYLMFRFTGHYYVEGVGYSTIMNILKGLFANPWLLFLILGAKLLATFLTLGSGGSGGIFSPSLYIGAVFGYAFGLLFRYIFPGFMIDPVVFAITGMAGVVGSVTGAILTGIIIVTELTHDTNIVMPIIITVSIAYATRKVIMSESIYTLKLLRRGTVVPEGLQSAMTLAIRAKNVMSDAFQTITLNELKKDPRAQYEKARRQKILTVVIDGHKVLGLLHPTMDSAGNNDVEAFLDKRFLIMSSETRLPIVIQTMEAYDIRFILVSPHRFQGQKSKIIGVITEHTILQVTYKTANLLY